MKFSRLSLRDLFWLTLFAAIAIGWGVDRYFTSRSIGEGSRYKMSGPNPRDPTQRLEQAASLREFSDERLQADFSRQTSDDYFDNRPYLLEFARRKLVAPLREEYERLQLKRFFFYDCPDLLTAIRRAEGKPDPLRVRATIVHVQEDESPANRGLAEVCLKNVDAEEPVIVHGKLLEKVDQDNEQWRLELTAPDGRRVPDAYFFETLAARLYGGATIPPGAASTTCLLNPRYFVSAPDSGRYTLQVFCSNSYLANEPDMRGLVVWKSDPIEVEVTNHMEQRPFSARTIAIVLALGFVAAVALKCRRPGIAWHRRDWLCLTLATAAAAGWWCDQAVMCRQITESKSRYDADWTIRLADAKS